MAPRSCHPLIAVVLLTQILAAGAAAQTVRSATVSSANASVALCDHAQFRVLLDVGHTIEEPGAISVRSVSEYDFNLRLARKIEQSLVEAGFVKTVVQITSGPARRALIKRVVDANAAESDLLVSIHHDSVPESLLQHIDEEGGPKRFSDRFKGHSIFVSHDNADRTGSLQFAKILGRQLKNKGLQYTPHYTEKFMGRRRRELLDRDAGVYRFDQLYVLRATRMPAVLFEAGLIINPAEELILASEERQKMIAAAVKDAVEAFCVWRASPAEKSSRARK